MTLRPLPVRRSQIAKPISFRPFSGPSTKWSSASASLPGGVFDVLGRIVTVTAAEVRVVSSCPPWNSVWLWFLRDLRNPPHRVLEDA